MADNTAVSWHRNWGASPRSLGGGIHCQGGVTILNGTVNNNQALNDFSNQPSMGGGICCSGTAFIDGCEISGNYVDHGNQSALGGGGIYCSGTTTVERCKITANVTPELGGGIHAAGSLAVSDCVIAGNTAQALETGVPAGGGIYCGNATIRNSVIAANTGWTSGGGIVAYSVAVGGCTVAGCTIVGNTSYYTGGVHGPATLADSIVWGNRSTTGDEAQVVDVAGISHSCVQGGYSGTGNISGDPLFIDAYGPDGDLATWADNNYHLRSGSPCIGAGDPGYTPSAGETDIDGNPRLLWGRLDMGADEFTFAADANCDGEVNVLDLQKMALSWNRQQGQAGYDPACDFTGDGKVNIFDLQVMASQWNRHVP